jgi:hypothetical protein
MHLRAYVLGALLWVAAQPEAKRVYFPEGVDQPEWLDARRKEQLETAKDFGVFTTSVSATLSRRAESPSGTG